MKAALLLASFLLFSAQATPPRDTQATPPRDVPAASGTGIIRGRVVSATSGDPLHRVRVTLNAAIQNPPTAVTDVRGEFEMTGVPAGTYSLTVARAGYLTIQYGQRRPREAGRTIEVRAGQVLQGIDMALPRGGVLAGVVSDDANDAYPGVRVEALEFRYLRGRRVLVQAASATTNDLGQFRIAGLQPGAYMLRASATDTWDSDDGKTSFAYATTYYPGVTGTEQAQSVNLNVGQDLNGLDFAMRSGRTARVHGVMQNEAGEPVPSQAISISYALRGIGGALFATGGPASSSIRTDRNGAFDFSNLPPGEYVVSWGNPADRATTSMVLSPGDVRSMVATARKPSALSGSVVTDEGTPPPFPPARLRVTPVPTDPDSVLPSFTGAREAAVGRDWTFRWTDIEGPYLFRVTGLPKEWMLAAVTLGGRNVADTPLDVPSGGIETKGLQLVLSQKSSTVSGEVLGRDGKPTPDSTVVIFAADSARWTIASRFVKAARPDNAGRFSVGGLPPGTYRAIARDFVADGQWEDPAFLGSIASDAVIVELGAGASETVTLKLEPAR